MARDTLSKKRPCKKSLPCKIDGCPRLQNARGWCGTHYQRWRHNGDPLIKQVQIKSYCVIDDCASPVSAYGYCMKHIRRIRRTGNPYTARKVPTVQELLERFMQSVEKTDSCWIWTGLKNVGGYGAATYQGRSIVAHRVSFFLHNGEWPKPYCLHSCDNRPCVNPAHLRAGTLADNSADRVKHGNLSFAKLTRDDVVRIRQMLRDGVTAMDISKMFGVHDATIGSIKRGETWKGIGE